MKIALRIVGILLLLSGIICAAWITIQVLSRAEGFTSLNGLIGSLVFHTVCMVLGTFIFGYAARLRPTTGEAKLANAGPEQE